MMQNFTPNEKTKISSSFATQPIQLSDDSLDDASFEKAVFNALDENLLEPSESIIKKILAYSKR